ncbi:MAG: hypothetical protein NT083_13600 [Rhodocyclales bacterium]|nr:hypothetical protein [Rhodocyclales bacterium]
MSKPMTEKLPAQRLMSCGEVSCEVLVNPIPRPEPEPIRITLKPKVPRVTLLDHKKPNSLAIMQFARQILQERGIEVSERILQKDDASTAMPAALLASLSQEPGLVLCGVSD